MRLYVHIRHYKENQRSDIQGIYEHEVDAWKAVRDLTQETGTAMSYVKAYDLNQRPVPQPKPRIYK